MVYCTKCGAKNEDDATHCVECGASLWKGRKGRSKEQEDMCFRGPGCFGGVFGRAAGIVFGVFIVFIGFIFLLQEYFNWEMMWPLIVIFFGALVIIGGILALGRRS